jgi:hypothetical protein
MLQEWTGGQHLPHWHNLVYHSRTAPRHQHPNSPTGWENASQNIPSSSYIPQQSVA